jgi:hypothetical protein
MVLVFFATVVTGGRRFAHVEWLRSRDITCTILDGNACPRR